MVRENSNGYFGDTFGLLLDLRSKPDRRWLFERRSPITVAPRRIAYPHRYADPGPIAVLRSIVFYPWSSSRLHSSLRIGKVTEQVVNIAISTGSLVISRSPILVIGDVLSSFRGRIRS